MPNRIVSAATRLSKCRTGGRGHSPKSSNGHFPDLSPILEKKKRRVLQQQTQFVQVLRGCGSVDDAMIGAEAQR